MTGVEEKRLRQRHVEKEDHVKAQGENANYKSRKDAQKKSTLLTSDLSLLASRVVR